MYAIEEILLPVLPHCRPALSIFVVFFCEFKRRRITNTRSILDRDPVDQENPQYFLYLLSEKVETNMFGWKIAK